MIAFDLLASAAVLAAPAPSTGPTPPWWTNSGALLPVFIIGIMLLFLMSSSKGRKNEEKQRQEMLANLKRGDRVQTIGGVLGTVVDTRDGEVVLKVDESSNTKIRFSREAIKRVMKEDEPAAQK